MEAKHMLMKGPDGPFTVPLLATDNKLVVTVGVRNVHLTASIERLFVYWLYVGRGKSEVIGWLREVAKISVSPMLYDAFIADFLNTHPKTPVSDYSLELIPMQADGTNGLALPIPFYECIISPDDEKELMRLYIETRSDQVYDVIVKWFQKYCKDYSYDFKKCKGSQYEYLYYAFLEQHGIYRYSIKSRTPAEDAECQASHDKKSKYKKRNTWESILRAIVLTGGYALVMWLSIKGIGCDALHDPNLLIDGQFICMLIFFLLLGGLIYLFLFPIYARNNNEIDEAIGVWRTIIAFIVHGFNKDGK